MATFFPIFKTHKIGNVEMSCCSDTHTMDRTLQTENSVVIYFEDYQLELIILSSILVCLLIVIIVGTFYQRRRREKYINEHFQTYKTHVIDDVLHVPILKRTDSFDESEEEEEEREGEEEEEEEEKEEWEDVSP
ncbi:hypothetical protein Anas_07249 [Armadillidium nasatum]|uniref:Uncharacterized protein n=1 Tax=Armadillidium nasatum TaxID=96803 RepID=A0A5N5SYR5_9CRUS|nr:hypothetical protein Anas_07249 [Armadillidium nasatum]